MRNALSDEYKIVILGGGGVGKSAITIRFVRSDFTDEYDPTIEDCYTKAFTVDGEKADLEILDTAGQEEFGGMRETYMRTGEGFILVYAVNDPDSFEELPPLAQQILRVKETDNFPMLIVGNKCDLERNVPTQKPLTLAQYFNGQFMETSAKERINIDQAFATIIRQIRDYRKANRPLSLPVSPVSTNSRRTRRTIHQQSSHHNEKDEHPPQCKCLIM